MVLGNVNETPPVCLRRTHETRKANGGDEGESWRSHSSGTLDFIVAFWTTGSPPARGDF